MFKKELQPGTNLKKSPFLVVKKLDNDEVRVYSKLHGNLTSYNFNIDQILKLFDSRIDVETSAKKIFEIFHCEPLSLIKELYNKRFIIEADKNEKDILLEYIEIVRYKNKNPKITDVTFLISAKCNLACKGCYHNFYDFKSSNMTDNFAGQILNGLFPYLKKRKIPELLISFLGYEPLLNFETLSRIHDKACRMSEEYGIKTSFKVYTNAFNLSREIFTWITKNKSNLGIKVSLDGIKEDHDKRRVDFAGEGTYDKVIENLKRIIMTDVECSVLIVLSKFNFTNIEQFTYEMAEIGIKSITANIFSGHSEDEKLLELTEEEKFEAIRRMDLSTEKYGIEFNGEWKFAVVQMITGAHFSCPAGIKQLVFSSDGLIYPCQRFAGTKMNLGIYEDAFWEKLIDGQCESYNKWTANLYDSVMDRTKEEDSDLAGWSCPFNLFTRGENFCKNPERQLNEHLIQYFVTRPLNRIITKSRIDYGY